MNEENIYKEFQKILQQESLNEVLGYDLYNDIVNFEWRLLSEGKKKRFREFIIQKHQPHHNTKIIIDRANEEK